MAEHWLQAGDKPHRKTSQKQETRIAKKHKGRLTSNSGAAKGQNDVICDGYEIEAKITAAKTFRLSLEDLKKMETKVNGGRFPIMLIEFENKRQYAVIGMEDLTTLLEKL